MRALSLLPIAICSAAAVAHAGTRIVFLTDPGRGNAFPAALEDALADRIAVSQLPPPAGALRLDRAATVQRAAVADHADAGLWIERAPGGAEVCVVTSDGRAFREAPLPPMATPRVFAAIASSLLDEVLAPGAPPALAIDLHLELQPPAPPPVLGPAVVLAPRVDASVGAGPRIALRRRALLEVGPTLTSVSYGLESELAFPILQKLRVGVLGGINHMFDGFSDEVANALMYDAALELRYVGQGTTHIDIGLAGGIANAKDDNNERDTGGFAALRLSVVRDHATSAVSVSVAPMLLFDFLGQSGSQQFGLMGSLRMELPI